MGKKILIIISAFVLVVIIGICLITRIGNDVNEEKEDKKLGTFPRYVEGEIIEIVDDNNIIIQIMLRILIVGGL